MLNGKKGKYLSLLLIFATGIVFSIAVSLSILKFENNKRQSLFSDLAGYRYKYIEDAIQNILAGLASFGDFYGASVSVERDEFDSFAQGIFARQPYIFEFRWLPKVKANERAEFELAAAASGLVNFSIKDIDKNDQLITASEHEQYFPVYYVNNSPGHILNHDRVIGLNAASIPLRWEAMQLARDTDSPATTEDIKHYGEPEVPNASRIFLPIYRNNLPHQTLAERRENLSGFVVLLYQIDKLTEYYLRGIPAAGVDIGIYNTASGKLLYFHPSRTRKELIKDSQVLLNNKFSWGKSLTVLNQDWKIVCVPAPEFLARHKIILPWIALVIGLLFTLILTVYLKTIINRAKVVELLVEQKTDQLRKAEEKYRVLYSASRDALMTIASPNWNFNSGNPAAIALFGVKDEQEFMATSPWALSPEYQPDGELSLTKAKRMIELALEKGSNYFEWQHKKISGEEFPSTVLLSRIKSESGVFVQATVRDITQEKQASERLEETKKELEIEAWGLAKANEGIKLLYKELEQKNEELKKFDQLKSDFVSIVSHELRTPLAIMKEGISLVLDNVVGEVGEKARGILDMVFANTNRLNKLINDMLDMSKIEAGRTQLKKSPVDINNLVKETAERWRIETQKREQELVVSTSNEKINLYLDADKIIQVFNNLISNAVKFTPAKGRIEISLQETKDNVEISVTDTGVGIPEEDLPKVFGKFQQFNRPVDSGSKGTGLGLAITKELVILHEGTIKVESKVGKGTRFTFTLPKKDTEEVFQEHIYNGIRDVMERNTVLSLISLRIAEFGRLQKELGQDQANDFLKGIERIINGFLRGKTDTIVRGSGELIVILPDVDKDGAKMVGQRIEEAMRTYLAGSNEEIIRKLSFDIGFAVYPEEAKTAEEVLQRARTK